MIFNYAMTKIYLYLLLFNCYYLPAKYVSLIKLKYWLLAKLIVRTSFLGNQRKISKWSIWQNFSSISDCMTGQYEGFGICKNAQYLHGNIKWVSSHFCIFVWSAWAEGYRGNLFVTIKCRLLQASIINFFMKPFRMVVRKSWSL